MPHFAQHIFICTNKRDPEHPRKSCAQKGSEEICAVFKQELKSRGLSKTMRANSSGCLDQCEQGPSVVIYPEQVWYKITSAEEVKEVVEQHLLKGTPVERLRMR